MSERYSKLFMLSTSLYAEGAPVVITAGALLKDNQTGRVLAQLKLQSISDKAIKAATVKLEPLDTIGKPLGEPVDFQYLDLNVARDMEFGQKTPIALPDAAARGFKLSVASVFFADNTAWSASGAPWEPLSVPVPLEQALGDVELAKQYRLQYGDDCKYQFAGEKDLWRCPCGALNHKSEPCCHKCQKEAAVFAALDVGKLRASRDRRLETERQQAAEKKAAEVVRGKKRRKIAVISCGALLIVVAALSAASMYHKHVIIPGKQYAQAEALLEAKDYEGAAAAFEALGDYKDAAQRAAHDVPYQQTEDLYQQAEDLEQEGQTAQAAIAFGKLGDHRDARARSFALWDQVAVRDTISVGLEHTVGLKSDGTVVATGNNEYGQCNVDSWTDIVAVAAGDRHTVGLKSDGTVVATGDDEYGQCDVDRWTDIVAVVAGVDHTVGLRSDGTIVATNEDEELDIESWTDIVAVSAGAWYTVGLKSDGTVVAAGNNVDGQCNVDGWTDIVAVAASRGRRTFGLKLDGTVVAVGDNKDGQWDEDGWTDIVAVSSGFDYTVGLKSDGTVVAAKDSFESGECDVDGWTDIVAVAAGTWHTVGLKSDGTMVATWDNEYGQYGQRDVGGWTNIKVPN